MRLWSRFGGSPASATEDSEAAVPPSYNSAGLSLMAIKRRFGVKQCFQHLKCLVKNAP